MFGFPPEVMFDILIVENDLVVARSLARRIRRQAEPHVACTVAQAADVLAARCLVGAILDVSLPDGESFPLISRLRVKNGAIPVLMVSGALDASLANRAHLAGAAFAYKPQIAANIDRFLEDVAAARASRNERFGRTLSELCVRHKLSTQETSVVELADIGMSREAIAAELGLAESTVKTVMRRALRKFDALDMREVSRRVRDTQGSATDV